MLYADPRPPWHVVRRAFSEFALPALAAEGSATARWLCDWFEYLLESGEILFATGGPLEGAAGGYTFGASLHVDAHASEGGR